MEVKKLFSISVLYTFLPKCILAFVCLSLLFNLHHAHSYHSWKHEHHNGDYDMPSDVARHWFSTEGPPVVPVFDSTTGGFWGPLLSEYIEVWNTSGSIVLVDNGASWNPFEKSLYSPRTLWERLTVSDEFRGCERLDLAINVCNSPLADEWGIVNSVYDEDGHITSSTMVLDSSQEYSEKWVSDDDRARPRRTLCHEFGHTLGLYHQTDEGRFDAFSEGDSCLESKGDPVKTTMPNAHDYDELARIYAHTHGSEDGVRCDLDIPTDEGRTKMQFYKTLDPDDQRVFAELLSDTDLGPTDITLWMLKEGLYMDTAPAGSVSFTDHNAILMPTDFNSNWLNVINEGELDTGMGEVIEYPDTVEGFEKMFQESTDVGTSVSCAGWKVNEDVFTPDARLQFMNISDLYGDIDESMNQEISPGGSTMGELIDQSVNNDTLTWREYYELMGMTEADLESFPAEHLDSLVRSGTLSIPQ